MTLEVKQIPPSLNQKHLPCLDGFRAISILAVIHGHIFFERDSFLKYYFGGDWGVHFFFVISGFLITTLLLKEQNKNGAISLRKFYIRRILRIFPVAYLFVFVILLFNFLFSLNIKQEAFLSCLLYIRNLPLFSLDDWYTAHFWSLSVEEQFYLLFPFLLKRSIRLYLITVLSLLFIIPIMKYLYFHGFNTNYTFNIVYKLFVNQTAILVGSFFAILHFKQRIKIPKLHSIPLVFLIFLSMIILSGQISFLPSLFYSLLSSSILSIVIISSIQIDSGWFYKFLNSRLFVEIGILSYSLYIWQQLFTYKRVWNDFDSFLLSTILNVLLLFAVSYISYWLYEKRFLNLKKRFSA